MYYSDNEIHNSEEPVSRMNIEDMRRHEWLQDVNKLHFVPSFNETAIDEKVHIIMRSVGGYLI